MSKYHDYIRIIQELHHNLVSEQITESNIQVRDFVNKLLFLLLPEEVITIMDLFFIELWIWRVFIDDEDKKTLSICTTIILLQKEV